MLQKFEIIPIPSAETPEDARGLLQRFAADRLPAVVIRNADTAGLTEAIAQLGDNLPSNVRTIAETRDFEFGNVGALSQLGMHHDHMPPVAGSNKELPMTYHLTHSGVAVASLFAAGSRFVERETSGEKRWGFGYTLEQQFQDGQVDTDLADPVCHQTTLTAGSLLLFKNGAPYWHFMDTQGAGRRSTAYDSTMAITPGMQVVFHEGDIPSIPRNWDAQLAEPSNE